MGPQAGMGDLTVSRLTNPVRRSDWKIVVKRRHTALRNTLIVLWPVAAMVICCIGDWLSS